MTAELPVTSFTDAIFSLLGRFGDELKAREAPEHSVKAYIFGGCAVHLYSSARVSSDLDLETMTEALTSVALREAMEEAGFVLVQKNAEEEPDLLELDLTYNTTLGPLHEDFEERARELEARSGSPLVVMLPAPEDLALSKLARLSEVDVQDILTLMSSPHASWELLEKLTHEVEGYYPAPAGSLTAKLRYVINKR